MAARVRTEAANVYRKNLPAASRRSGPPQTPIRKKLGTRVNSKQA